MNIEDLRNYCLAKSMTTEELPFDEHTLVFKVAGKVYALTSLKDFKSVNLKCNPERAIQLREQYQQIIPGYHMNKIHWNTVTIHGLKTSFIQELIDHSYDLIVSQFSKKKRQDLGFC